MALSCFCCAACCPPGYSDLARKSPKPSFNIWDAGYTPAPKRSWKEVVQQVRYMMTNTGRLVRATLNLFTSTFCLFSFQSDPLGLDPLVPGSLVVISLPEILKLQDFSREKGEKKKQPCSECRNVGMSECRAVNTFTLHPLSWRPSKGKRNLS